VKPGIFSNSSFVELNIFLRFGNSSSKFFEIVGPTPGNPSRINCFCSSGDRKVFDGRIAFFIFGFSYFFAVRIRNFAVSDSFSV